MIYELVNINQPYLKIMVLYGVFSILILIDMLNPRPSSRRTTFTVKSTRPNRGEESRDPLHHYIGKLPLNVRASIARLLSHETRANLAQASRGTFDVEGAVSRQVRINIIKNQDKLTEALLNLITVFNQNLTDNTSPSQSITLKTPFLINKDDPQTIGIYIINIAHNYNVRETQLQIYFQSITNISSDIPKYANVMLLNINIPIIRWGIELKNTIKEHLLQIPIRFFENFTISGVYLVFLNRYGLSYSAFTIPNTNEVIYEGSLFKNATIIKINKPFVEYVKDVNKKLSEEKASPGISSDSLEKLKNTFGAVVEFYKNFNPKVGGRKRKPSAK